MNFLKFLLIFMQIIHPVYIQSSKNVLVCNQELDGDKIIV